jgi:hypothetical protein
MSRPVGRNLPLSPTRLLVADLMHFAQQIPLAALDRRMDLAPLAAARRACAVRPSWSGLFARAFAIVAARRPELRRSYLSFPWPHLYEHPESVAAIVVERAWNGEVTPFITHLAAPDRQSLGDFDARLQRYRDCPIQQFPTMRRVQRMLRLPRPLRRLVWWAALNLHGPSRARNIGTFAVTSTAAHGAGVLQAVGPTTSILHCGMMDENANLDVRLSFDHRVLDGGPVARALADLEDVLLNEVLAELRGMQQAHAAQGSAQP